THVRVDLVGTAQNVDLDVEVKFTHALQNRLAGLLISRNAEGRILGSELRESQTELFLVGLRLRLDGDLDHRLRELHTLKDDGLVGVAERVTRTDFLEACESDDVAG